MQFILEQILFYISLILVLFVPGYFLLLAVFGKSETLGKLEKFVVAFGLSIVSVDFILFALSKTSIAITRWSIISGIVLFGAICFGIFKLKKPSESEESIIEEKNLFNFSKKQFILILLLIFLTIFIKTFYLSGAVLPTSTDMGHHMYWAKWMTENNQLPTYEGMPDFIIGEHTIFGTMALIGNLDFFSAFPPVILFLFNLLGIFTVFILTLRIFKNQTVAILTLLFLGVLFAVSSPQAKFVSGGVVGNIMGNFLLPLAFYFFYRALAFFSEERKAGKTEQKFLALAIFTTFGLFYTHHLTAFIFLFIFAFLVALFLLLNFRDLKNIFSKTLKLFSSPIVPATLATCLIFFFWVFTPNYIQTSAVDTAVGAPSKATREGLSVSSLKDSIGEVRLALGFLGLLFLVFSYQRKNFGHAIIASWGVMIFVMSSVPQILFINLPSNRIGNYLSYPFAILGAFGFWFVFQSAYFKNQANKNLFQVSFLLVFVFALVNGLSDSAVSISAKDTNLMTQTFHSADYLTKRTAKEDVILKDHNYINSDSWMKLFFMRGYKYPDSRGFFKRYEDITKPREMCTLYMISNPAGAEAEKCFSETNTKFIMVNPQYDSAQFLKLKNFDQIYTNDNLAIYQKND
jgi:hypothetical protein